MDEQANEDGQAPGLPQDQVDAVLFGQFMQSVEQSRQMLLGSGAPEDRARDIAFARSLLFLPDWHVIGCAVEREGRPVITRLSLVEVRGVDDEACPSLAVFPTVSLAEAEVPRMRVPEPGGRWVAISIPTAEVLPWIRSMKLPAISVVTATNASAPSCILGLDFIEWVKSVESQTASA
ncbi:MAG: hypothetical protein RLZZ238_2072 [Planctomycetota bacterium]